MFGGHFDPSHLVITRTETIGMRALTPQSPPPLIHPVLRRLFRQRSKPFGENLRILPQNRCKRPEMLEDGRGSIARKNPGFPPIPLPQGVDMDTKNYIEVIETVITSLKQEESGMVTHSQEGYLWKFQYGTVEVFVQITGLTDDDTFTVWSMVLKPPFKNEPTLFRKLLEMNSTETLEARFAILGDQVAVVSTRSTTDLSASEISSAITTVATLADYYDEPLQEEFGA